MPAANLIGLKGRLRAQDGDEGAGEGRVIAAVAVGVAKRMLRDALAYSLERKQFGHAICDFQLVQAMLADSQAELYAAECMTLDAAPANDGQERVHRGLLRQRCSPPPRCAAARGRPRGVQILGGAGYMEEYGMERFSPRRAPVPPVRGHDTGSSRSSSRATWCAGRDA